MSKININDYSYRYPKEAIAQWKKTGIIPEELLNDNLDFLIRDGKYVLVTKNSKINFEFAKKLVERFSSKIEALKLNEDVEIKIKEIDIHAKRLEQGIVLRYTCKVFTWENLKDVLLEP